MFDSNYPETCKRSIIVKGTYNYTSIAKPNIVIDYVLVWPLTEEVIFKSRPRITAVNIPARNLFMNVKMLTVLFMIAV